MFGVKIEEKGNLVYISSFPIRRFREDIKRFYKTARISNLFTGVLMLFGKGILITHRALLPEIVYVLQSLNSKKYNKIANDILEKTWMKSTLRNYPRGVNSSKFSDFYYSLKPYQKEFIDLYDEKKQKYNLFGYVLAFEQGLGKTFTSIALMHSLNKTATVIIAPKSTLKTVWRNEIQTVFKDKKKIWVVGEPPINADFFIVNYESIDKLNLIMKHLMTKNVGIIVDESHNFTNTEAKRVIALKSIANKTQCQDILLMSGTPIRALGKEMIPTLELLDPYFDELAKKIFLNALGVSVPVALDILKNRLGMMMHRKMKTEVINLPDKKRLDVKIKISNGKEYTLTTVKKKILNYMTERQKFYTQNRKTYEKDFEEVLKYLKKKVGDTPEFRQYMTVLEILKRYGYDPRNPDLVNRVANANKYEKEVLRPLLPPDLRKKFDQSKAVVKYVNLKIMGEVLGGLLNKLRADMFSDMVKASPICKIISESKKKTVCFTTFVDVVKITNDYLLSQCKAKPLLIFGETSGSILPMLKNFKEDTTVNPLVATIQTLSTGVTLTEANTVIFLNKPWRHTDAAQAEDRVHRIGQDTEVVIYTFILDTGSEANLSTRMEDVISWSKEMFEGIVGVEGDPQIKAKFRSFFNTSLLKLFR
jgi:SNF2 family DNA or RNA helicase